MKLDNWLAQRAQSCPDRVALVAEGSEVDYAELEAEATWVARRLAAHGVRRGAIAALTMNPGREQVVLLHALMKLGAVVLPLSPRLSEAERAAVFASERAGDRPHDAGQLTQTEADLPLLGEHDMDRDPLPHPHRRLSGTARGRADLRQPPLERRRVRLQHRRPAATTAGSAACR